MERISTRKHKGHVKTRFAKRPAKTAAVGTSGVKKHSKFKTKRKQVISFIIGVLLIGIISLFIILLQVIVSFSNSEERRFSRTSCEEKDPTPIHINECMKAACTFDLLSCSLPCPFGFQTDERGCEISCECASVGNFQGDIHFNEESILDYAELYGYIEPQETFEVFSGSASSTEKLWNEKPEDGRHRIAYQFHSSLSKKAEKSVLEAIKTYRELTCIDFVPRKKEAQYFLFASKKGCWSVVGKYKKPGQPVSIGKGCERIGTVQHELLHLLGFYHEHSRPDRDAYLIVNKANIAKSQLSNFKKRAKSQVKDFDSEYDTGSLMQYPSEAFSSNGKYTIVEKETGRRVEGQRNAFSKEDLHEVNSLYNCLMDKGPQAKWTEWGKWSSCDETCGPGYKLRFRKCLDEDNKHVEGCKGKRFEKVKCSSALCPMTSGSWDKWNEFGECSKTCDGGFQWRRRICSVTDQCKGMSYEGKPCNELSCEGVSAWGEWTTWSSCSLQCGTGKKSRKRQCFLGKKIAFGCDDGDGTGRQIEEADCNRNSCDHISSDGEWGLWTSCSSTCSGTRSRLRTCHEEGCSGNEEEMQDCNVGVCQQRGVSMYGMNANHIPEVLCKGSILNYFYFGDFNNDKRTDVLCTSTGDVYNLGYTDQSGSLTKLNWEGTLTGCQLGSIYVGDFNGDGKDDVVCQDATNKRLKIKPASDRGGFSDESVNAGNFCTGASNHIILIDANGDGKRDILCYFSDNHVELRLNTVQF